MGYIFDFKDTIAYDQWFEECRNKTTVDLQQYLMSDMLRPNAGETVLDIGCGTGMSLKPFFHMNLQLTGIDPSPYMLDIASKRFKKRVDFHRGFAEDLPFDDNSFTHSILSLTLEFVDNPQKALEEAFRITKDSIFIGILNRYALKGIQRRIRGIFTPTIYNHARFSSIWEIKRWSRTLLGDVPIAWRTVCQFPTPSGKLAHKVEESAIVQHCPFGAFGGLLITLVPRFKTTPLRLKYNSKQSSRVVTG